MLTGVGFTGATAVTVGSVPQPFMIDSDTQLTIPALSDATPIGADDLVVERPDAQRSSIEVHVIRRLQISEIDSDTPGSDELEFVEISTGVPDVSLAGYTLVFQRRRAHARRGQHLPLSRRSARPTAVAHALSPQRAPGRAAQRSR